MYRRAIEGLNSWFNNEFLKPLIISGARPVAATRNEICQLDKSSNTLWLMVAKS